MKKDKGQLILNKFLADMTAAKKAGDKEKEKDLMHAFVEDIQPFPNKKQLGDIAVKYLGVLTILGKDPLDDVENGTVQ